MGSDGLPFLIVGIVSLVWRAVLRSFTPGLQYVHTEFFSVSHTIALHLPHMMSLAMNNEPVVKEVTASHLYGRSCTEMNSSSNVSDSTDRALSLNDSNTNYPYTPK